MAFTENSCRAGAADRAVETRVDRLNRLALVIEDVLAPDLFDLPATIQHAAKVGLHANQIQTSTQPATPDGLLGEHFGASQVDEVDGTRKNHQMLLPRIGLVDIAQLLLHMFDGAEEDRAFDT